MIRVKAWTDYKKDFMRNLTEEEYFITIDNRLINFSQAERAGMDMRSEKEKGHVRHSFFFIRKDPEEVFYLRRFCEIHHPEVDFDSEFETDRPGVFARYQEKFGYDYEDWIVEQTYKEFSEELSSHGYTLPWEDPNRPELSVVPKRKD